MAMGLRILGGIAQGVGSGLTLQHQENARSAAADVAHRRELALAEMRQQYTRDNMELQGDIQDRNAGRNAQRQDFYGARSDARRTDSQLTVQNDQQGHQLSMEQLQHRNRLTVETLEQRFALERIDREEANRLAREAAERGQEVAHWEVDTNGYLQGFNGRGQVIAQSRSPRFDRYRGRPDTDGDDATIGGARAGRGGGGAGAPASRPPAPAAARGTDGQGDGVPQQLARWALSQPIGTPVRAPDGTRWRVGNGHRLERIGN